MIPNELDDSFGIIHAAAAVRGTINPWKESTRRTPTMAGLRLVSFLRCRKRGTFELTSMQRHSVWEQRYSPRRLDYGPHRARSAGNQSSHALDATGALVPCRQLKGSGAARAGQGMRRGCRGRRAEGRRGGGLDRSP